MRLIAVLLLVSILTGCATVDYQPYVGRNNIYKGDGGTKVTSNGVDFWANGAPPRGFSIIGVASSEVGAGWGDEAMIRSAVASEVKKQGGDAAIQIGENSRFVGFIPTPQGGFMGGSAKQLRFHVIKYVD